MFIAHQLTFYELFEGWEPTSYGLSVPYHVGPILIEVSVYVYCASVNVL